MSEQAHEQLRSLTRRLLDLPAHKQAAFLERLKGMGIHATALPILSEPRRQQAPLSYAQQRLWLIDQLEPGSSAYNVVGVLKLKGPLDRNALTVAVQRLVERHAALRTTFAEVGGEPVQRIEGSGRVQLTDTDLSSLPGGARTARALAIAAAEAQAGFDLERGPLLRLKLIRLSEEEHWLALTLHHIVSDEWSNDILVSELLEFYAAEVEARPPALSELSITYADFADWQRRFLDKNVLAEQLAYWKAQLETGDYSLQLPSDKARGAGAAPAGAEHLFDFDAALVSNVAQLARAHGATPFMVVLAAYAVLLSRYCGESDIRIGVPIANRTRPETEPVVGYFVNTQVLRISVAGCESFAQHLERVRQVVLDAQNHQDLPFDHLVEALRPKRERHGTPLFQVMLSWHAGVDVRERSLAGLCVSFERLETRHAKFDLALHVSEAGMSLAAQLVYRSDRFTPAFAGRMAEHLRVLLADAAQRPEARLDALSWTSTEEVTSALAVRSEGAGDVAAGSIHDWIRAVADAHPSRIAVQGFDGALTYSELEQRANALAGSLLDFGVAPESRVALVLRRGVDAIVGLYAILKCGAAYVPVEPTLPQQRIASLLQDAGVRVIVAHEALAALAEEVSVRLVAPVAQPGATYSVGTPVSPENAAYVIYTSGSTGLPKGVVVTHANLANYVRGLLHRVEPPDASHVAVVSTLSADLGNTALFGALCSGATLHVVPEDVTTDAERFADYVKAHPIDVMKVTPSHLAGLLSGSSPGAALPRALLILGGEAASPKLVAEVLAHGRCRLVNHYGPTETTIGALTHEVTAAGVEGVLPLGLPLPNARAYVLDAALRPMPVGIPGELFLGGPGVARGYLGRPGLTAERFVPDPFGAAGDRLYKSGDRAKYRSDGTIEFVGRVDDQVKVRGYRVEPAEVRRELLALPCVAEAFVTSEHEPGASSRLIAYLVAYEHRVDAAELRHELSQRLPDYMIPSVFVWLDALPVTPNGKVDAKALPEPQQEAAELDRSEPRNELEAQLLAAFRSVLKLAGIGVHANFFACGGDSLTAFHVVAHARRLGIRFAPALLFSHQSVAELALALDAASPVADSAPRVPNVATEQVLDIPLTPIQRWFFDQDFGRPQHWNQGVVLECRSALDSEQLRQSLLEVVAHHEALRLRFAGRGSECRQHVADAASAAVLEVVQLGEALTGAAVERIASDLHQRLDFERGPVLRAAYVTDLEGASRLLVVAHHLVVDGMSWRILVEDWETAYKSQPGEAKPLPPPTTPFSGWAHAVRRYAEGDRALEQLRYWQQVHEAPGALNAASVESASTFTVERLELDAQETARFLAAARDVCHAEPHEVLLHSVAQTLCAVLSQPEVLVEVESHGRHGLFEGIDLSRTMGWFTCFYPMRVSPDPEHPVRSVQATQQRLREVPEGGFGYGVLRYLKRQAFAGSEPCATFNYLGRLPGESDLFRLSGESMGPARDPGAPRRRPIEVTAKVALGRLTVEWTGPSGGFAHRHHAELRQFIELARGEPALASDLGASNREALAHVGVSVEDAFALTPMQEGILFHSLLEAGSGIYVNQKTCRFESDAAMDAARLRAAFQRVLDAEPTLRTGFVWDGLERPLQFVRDGVSFPFECIDVDEDYEGGLEHWFSRWLAADRTKGFELSAPPLVRATLLRTGGAGARFVLTNHQLLLDGWSSASLFTRVLGVYAALTDGREPPRSAGASYRDYVAWRSGQDPEASRGFWRRKLGDFDAPTYLAPEQRREDGVHDPARVALDLPDALVRDLRRMCSDARVTLNTVFQAAVGLLIGVHARSSDVLFGVTVSGRDSGLRGIEQMLGLLIHTLPLRLRIEPSQSIGDWLRELQRANAEMRQHDTLGLTEIARYAATERGSASFDTLLVFENYPVDADLATTLRQLGVSEQQSLESTNYPLTIVVVPGAVVSVELAHDRRLLSGGSARRLLAQLERILTEFARGSSQFVGAVSLLEDSETAPAALVRSGGNDALVHAPLVHEAIAEHARRTPDNVAVACAGETLTFRQLDALADQVAQQLRAHGVGLGEAVGVCLEHSPLAVAGLLGVWKAGAMQVFLDPELPDGRLHTMMTDARVAVVLTQGSLLARVSGPKVRLIALDDPAASAAPQAAASTRTTGDALAYCLYTSGSTGGPKGVVVSHRQLLNYVCWGADAYGLRRLTGAILQSSFGFDLTVTSLWLPLYVGATVCIVPEKGALAAEAIVRALEAASGSWLLKITPAHAAVLAQQLSPQAGMRVGPVVIGGEALTWDCVQSLARVAPNARFVNEYGPTETVVGCSVFETAGHKERDFDVTVPIGVPVANTGLYVLDSRLRPVPRGVVGELYIGGNSVSLGYRGRPDLTAHRFLPDPWSPSRGARMYRSGDLVRCRPDGSLEFLGRADQQIKLRGYRVEPAEVAAHLKAMPEIADAAVIALATRGRELRLLAYVVPRDGLLAREAEDHSERRAFVERIGAELARLVPEYMVPAEFIVLGALPLTANGKLDRSALPAPTGPKGSSTTPPRTSTEHALVEIWRSVLGLEHVGVHDDFFELGGDSLSATRALSAIRSRFASELPLRRLFEATSIARLAELLDAEKPALTEHTAALLAARLNALEDGA